MTSEKRRAVQVLVTVAVLAAAVTIVLRAAHERFAIWYPTAIAVAVVACVLVVRRAWDGAAAPSDRHGAEPELYELPGIIRPLERKVAASQRQRESYRTELQPTLVRFAQDRLARHDIEWGPPARSALGEEAWQWLTTTDDRGPAPTPRTLRRIVDAIERS